MTRDQLWLWLANDVGDRDRLGRMATVVYERRYASPPTTQRALAKRFGISVTRVAQIEWDGVLYLKRRGVAVRRSSYGAT